MARLFGTDGVRGIANVELTPELAFKLGRAAASYFHYRARYTPFRHHAGSCACGRYLLCGRQRTPFGCNSYAGCFVFNFQTACQCRCGNFRFSQSV